MRRLYIGGLSHTVTQKDLKDRFGKFGDVEDVEVRTRRDDEGVPYKTFGYINISISDADLKKCLTVLNKSKWKGGTLQIETAKESFLHRLAEERQAAAEQRLQQPAAEDKRQKMLDSLSKAGVENFTMKAAVPGTEIPGHKDWVVSKFGRVLPVLQLRCQKGSKARTQKYDPSKYSHNIRKLDRSTVDESTPVTQLTWELQGGDDDISKKRRGEFPPYEPPKRKKSRTDSSQNAVGRNRFKQTDDSVGHNETHQFTNGCEPPTNYRLVQKRPLRFTDSDIDSDEEIRRMVASQNSSHVALRQEEEEDILEVVGLDYLEKSGRVRQQQKGGPDDEEENGYDSADTDELFASRKPPPPQQERLSVPTEAHLSGNDTDGKKKTKKKSKAGEEGNSSTEEHLLSRKPSSTQQRAESSQKQSKKMTVPTIVKPPVSQSDSDEDEDDEEDEDEEELESADYSSDSDYEAMFSNATRLEISFADLKRLAEESQQTSETTSPSIPGTSSEQETNLTSGPAERPAPKKGTMPDEILAAIMEEDSSEDEQKRKKKKRKAVVSAPLPAFQGTRALGEGSETHECQRRQKEEEEGRGVEVKKQKLEHPETEKKTSESSDEEEEEREEQEKKGVVKSMTRKAETVSSFSSDDDEDEDDDDEDVEDEDGEESESADYSSDSDYEAMFSNITRLEISFADLQRLAEESQQTSETTAPSIPGTSCKQETDLTSGPAEPPAQKQKLDSEAPQLNHRAADSKTSRQKHTDTEKKTSESSEEEEVEEEEEEEIEQEKKGVGKNITGKTETVSSSSSDDDEDEEEEEEEEDDKMKANQTVLTVKTSAKASSSSSGSSASSSEEEEEEVKQAPPRVPLGAKEEEERQREANLRRLAAVQQRQKEAEEHKKLIQGALANLDAPTAGAGKHIVFGSDDDDDGDGEDKKQITSEVTVPKKTLFQDSQSEDEATGDEAAVSKSDTTKEKVRLKPSGPQLFSVSDDEEDADEEDGSRFDIRPQFEGRSGQKLMELQSRFGTDERFRMDSRFLEEDEDKEEDSEKKKSVTEEEEALEEEKKKNLSILQSVLGSSQQTCSSKTPTKAKTFRDVSALHYDPSREEHTAFETKTDETKKESKAARRKKREEAQKLPEVSKEIFYDVSGDLKAVFGQTKEDDVAGEDEKKNWDQEEEDEEEEGGKDEQPTPLSSLLSADPSVEKVESSGFKFSFFGDDTETGSGETTEYKIESIQAPKVSWQQNLHFQDSSSDEEEEEKEEEEQSNVVATTTEEETSSKRDLFFFHPEDIRLKEGPRLFCRPSQLEEQREQWEERRSELKQEYRKKHKDARRKLKSSLKS